MSHPEPLSQWIETVSTHFPKLWFCWELNRMSVYNRMHDQGNEKDLATGMQYHRSPPSSSHLGQAGLMYSVSRPLPSGFPRSTGFVTRSGTHLMLNGQPFRFAGANIHWLALDDSTIYPS